MQHLLKDEDVSVTLFQGMEGLESLRDAWNGIVSGMPRRHFFHLWEWHYSYLKCLEHGPNDVRFYLLKRGDTPVAVFPLQVTEISLGLLKLKALAFPSHNHVLLCDLICREDALHLPLFLLFSEYLRNQAKSWDVIHLPHLLEDACAIQAINNHPPKKFLLKHEGRCDFMDTTGTYESFLSDLSKNFRRSLKRAKQYLDELPELRFAFVQNGPELDEGFEAFLDVEASGWKGVLGSGTAIKLHPNLVCFYRTLARSLSASGKVSINTLTTDGKCIAAQFCLRLDDTVYILKIGYDEGYKRYAPGNVLLDLFMKKSMEDCTIKNMNLITDAEWHADWKPKANEKSALYLFNTTPSGLIGYAILKSYPSVKKYYRAYIQAHLPGRIQEWIGRLAREA